MSASVWTESITFSGGETVTMDEGSITVLVGPNNSGKTSSLREISQRLGNKERGNVVAGVKIEKRGETSDIKSWLDQNVSLVPYHGSKAYTCLGTSCDEGDIAASWAGDSLGKLGGILCSNLSIDKRFSFLTRDDEDNPYRIAEGFNILKNAPKNPIQVLLADTELEAKVSYFFKQAFGGDLTLARGLGYDFPLFFGERPEMQDGEDRVSREYLKRLSRLPLLSRQGHGMRSFAECVMATLTSPSFVKLIDEPEAFLHPPQARHIGNLLARSKAPNHQLIFATHSGDFLRGVLDCELANLKIIRLTRHKDVNHARQLNVNEIRNLWADPILRFSNVLDGLFHESVIVCESDSDCRFYAAVLDAINDSSRAKPDILFSSSGGKHRMPVVVAALAALGVPVRLVADLDILKDEYPLRRLVEILGGDWVRILPDWRETKRTLEEKAPPLSKNQVRAEIQKILDVDPLGKLSEEEVDSIRSTLRATSSWGIAKQAGLNALPTGQPRERANRMLNELRSIGIFVVECGEIERFVPSVGGHGPKWTAEVLKRELSVDPELEVARKFISKLCQVMPTHPTSSNCPSPESQHHVRSPLKRRQRWFHFKRAFHHFACSLGLRND